MMMKNQKEEFLHQKLHKKKNNIVDLRNLFRNPRLKIFPYVEKILNKKISGSIFDVGAGNGYAGLWLAKNREVSVVSLECTDEAAHVTIPYYAKQFGVDNLVKTEKGSFYDLSCHDEEFDFVVCFGALHHSRDLLYVLKNIYKTLKPGGILIAQEPSTSDHIDNQVFINIYDSYEEFAGEIIRHGDRDDRFYRKCEYLTALHHSNFNIIHESDATDLLAVKNSFLRLLLRRIHQVLLKIIKIVMGVDNNQKDEVFSRMRERVLKPRKWLVVCQKPIHPDSYVPHVWCRKI